MKQKSNIIEGQGECDYIIDYKSPSPLNSDFEIFFLRARLTESTALVAKTNFVDKIIPKSNFAAKHAFPDNELKG